MKCANRDTHREAVHDILKVPTQLRYLIRVLVLAICIRRFVAHPSGETVAFAVRFWVRRGQPLLDGGLDLLEYAESSRMSATPGANISQAYLCSFSTLGCMARTSISSCSCCFRALVTAAMSSAAWTPSCS
jgi:hypothetical protein